MKRLIKWFYYLSRPYKILVLIFISSVVFESIFHGHFGWTLTISITIGIVLIMIRVVRTIVEIIKNLLSK